PVNEGVGPYIEQALRPLIDAGFLEVCYGGIEQGQYLTDHPAVGSIHITGSARAHDTIVWGVGEQGEHNRAANTPRLDKHISSELGAVGPVFVVPGKWSDKAIDYHARNVVAMVTYNAGFNCNGARLIVTASGWPQREAFIERVEHHLNATPSRVPYYPRAAETLAEFTERYPEHSCSPLTEEGHLPWTVLRGVSTDPSEYALRNEPWVGLTSHVELKASDAADFLSAMVAFGNDHCAGTLATQILIDPKSEREHQERFNRALGAMRFGLIGINCWSGLGYGIVNATWGAFPGHPLSNIESGQGVVHNGLLLDSPEKSVVRTPFIMNPTPAWFTDHRNNIALGQKMVAFEAAPSWWKVPGIAAAALRG
ncbi:MAG TPA: NAD-dependent aldehyde dehydrogenase, partial [Myxococcales bacterium]|nr:NAD-dependent aldehyde dehydrogenase [Myxococcales bacterium]